MRIPLKNIGVVQLAKQHAYVDLDASLRTSAWLIESGGFDYYSFAELCNLLDAVVLYEKLYTCPCEYSIDPTTGRPCVDLISPFLKGLIRENMLTYLDQPSIIPRTDEYQTAWAAFRNAQIEAQRIWHIEQEWGVIMSTVHKLQIHPSISNSPGYLKLLRVESSVKATVALLQAYRHLSRAVTSDIERVIAAGGQVFVPIPPITLEILKRVSKPAEILEEAFLLRRKFRTVREVYSEYAEKISNDELRIEKRLVAHV
jgi:hypothetical protein